MKIWHRISFHKSDGVDEQLSDLGVVVKISPLPGDSYILTFEIDESDERWPEISKLLKENKASDISNTSFNEEEILAAEWVRIAPSFEQGYPAPGVKWRKNRTNYDDYCPECGTYRQVDSYHLEKEPKLGKRDFVCLYWTYTLFCTDRVLKELKSNNIRGYEVWDAIIHKTNTPSKVVSQLYIPGIAKPGLKRVEDLKRKICSTCNVTKYYPHMRGKMHLDKNALIPDVDIMLSYEWFGSGHAAYREFVASNKLARLIIEKGWKGVSMKVIELI